MKVRLGDIVRILSGRDRGKDGKITKILRKTDQVIVEGVNLRYRHVKRRDGQAGERVEFFAPIHVSNVAVLGADGKLTRIGYQGAGKGKIRIDRKTGKELVQQAPKATKKKADKKDAPDPIKA